MRIKYTKIIALSLSLLTFLFVNACDENPGTTNGSESASAANINDGGTAEGDKVDGQSSQKPDSSKPDLYSAYKGQTKLFFTGAEVLINARLNMLKGKRLAIVANQTSRVFNQVHLVDTLTSLGLDIVKVFAPEHGFRGTADAGESVKDGVDTKTGLPIISLYGKNRKPTAAQLEGVDMVLFDIQDVGVRLYTYISSMSYVMEACAENNVGVMVLDRPNPNGWYVDGPVLEKTYSSFIGLHEIPVVHGMTIGEYAKMVNGEAWLKGGLSCALTVVPCIGYRHEMRWEETGLEWVPPSPNLGTEYSAYLYPALVWLEPTPVSLGRGTDDAFTMAGSPWFNGANTDMMITKGTSGSLEDVTELTLFEHSFTPVSLPGKAKYPKFQDKSCSGVKFGGRAEGKDLLLVGVQLFKDFYAEHQKNKSGESFFKKGFEKWPGNADFRKQIESGQSAADIYGSWQADVEAFKGVREKYLMYE